MHPNWSKDDNGSAPCYFRLPPLLTSCCDGQVKVKRRGDDQKFIAEVLAIGIECDIALLTVKDETFWEGVKPLSFGPLPRLQVPHSDCLLCKNSYD